MERYDITLRKKFCTAPTITYGILVKKEIPVRYVFLFEVRKVILYRT